jgi:phosphopantothenate-cysteine ligase/phosphopantothenoylcysteine decarboxylase/phosphopantothenate--cysteine ligase
VLGKLPSSHEEVWLRLVPTPKLIDRMRRDWGFPGVLVKFKLECGVSEETLLARAEQSRQRSAADLVVANLLESLSTTAWLGPLGGTYRRLPRSQLADVLLDAVESLHARASR